MTPPEHINEPSTIRDSAKPLAGMLLDVLEAHGVKDIVCSPGSRNAPLLMAARARRNLAKHIIVDERTAAFTALGMATVSRRPTALICTSGTAILNYAPAVAEAYYQGVPLIVISADRPTEWIDQDDSQTIRQFESLANFVKGSYDISDREQRDLDGWYENRIANDAMLTALRGKKGPVHINVRLSPPLNEMVELRHPAPSPRIIREVADYPMPDKNLVKELAARIVDKKVLVTLGFLAPDARLNRAMLRLRDHDNVAVMAETISNTHLPQEDYVVDAMLCNLTDKQTSMLEPDVVISVGGALVSRMLKEFIRKSGRRHAVEHWSVGPTHTTVDCFQTLSLRIDADPALFLAALSAEMAHLKSIGATGKDAEGQPLDPSVIKGAHTYASSVMSNKRIAMSRVFSFASDAPWSELVAFIDILNNIPASANLFLSNGTTVRYAQLVPYALPHASYCNRGVSGIEGSTSTAVGGAMLYSGETVLITGDMSFSYDLGGLSAASRFNPRLKIIVIRNGGGGIFRFIKATSSLPDREEYLCADPGLNIAALASTFGFAHMEADSLPSLRERLAEFFNSPARTILEVIVPPNKSALLLKQFLKQ